MKSYTGGRNLYGSWTKNIDTTNLTLGDEMANDEYRKIVALKDWPFLERLRTLLTTAGRQFYPLPYDTGMVSEVSMTVGTTRYPIHLAPSQMYWDYLNQNQYTSNIPEWYFVFNGQIGIFPIPSVSSNTIRLRIKARVIDLSIADYVTGTIASVTNGGTTVTGTTTVWTSQMVGRYIRIKLLDTVGSGDGIWYEIASVTNTTTLELVRAYGGTTITAGTAQYTIGQMPLLPEEFHATPWRAAAAIYWEKEDSDRAPAFNERYNSDIKALTTTWSMPTTDIVIDEGMDARPLVNPNLFITL